MVRRLAILIALTFVLPASAHAATLTNAAGVLTYTGAPGKVSNVIFVETAAGGSRSR